MFRFAGEVELGPPTPQKAAAAVARQLLEMIEIGNLVGQRLLAANGWRPISNRPLRCVGRSLDHISAPR